MYKPMKLMSIVAASCVGMLVAAGPLAAQETNPNQTENQSTENLAVYSDLMNARVMDQQNNELGTIKNVVLQEPTGQIRYVVLDVNGNKVAVPWSELTAQNTQGQNQTLQFTVNQTRDQLENAPKFDENNLSNLSQANTSRESQSGVTGSQDTTAQTNTMSDANHGLVLASQIKQAKVQTASNEQVGEITNLVVNTSTGQVQYGVVQTNGKEVAVPWSAFHQQTPSQNEENMKLVVNRTEDQLQSAPTFNRNDLSNLSATTNGYGATTG
jgi:sporulation protein YlmC with PRC-barrel domain